MNRRLFFLTMVFLLSILMTRTIWAQIPGAPASLKTVSVPEPPNLSDFVVDRIAAIRLGKALFWDMQVGSDGVMACATCHFHAGADSRAKNQFNPGLNHTVSGNPHPSSTTFEMGRPNSLIRPDIFPVIGPNDVNSSQGVLNTQFVDIVPGSAVDVCSSVPDPVFNVGGLNVRKVAARNSPSVINAVFNFANFWDGRANNIFNGVNPFGPADVNARILVNDPVSGLIPQKIALINSSLASQAVGPMLSDFEMSCGGRTFPKVGKKMLSLIPLGKQLVHPEDSFLGSLSRALMGGQRRLEGNPGLSTTYVDLIRAAFHPRYWSSDRIVTFPNGVMTIGNPGIPQTTDEYTQMEANFPLFFGLAIQMYEATLVSNDSPYDRFQEGNSSALTLQQIRGASRFLGAALCIECHFGAEFTGATVSGVRLPEPGDPPGLQGEIERMPMAQGVAFYDVGFYNIAVTVNQSVQLPNGDTQTTETYDIGRGGSDPFGNPLAFSRLAFLKRQPGALHPDFAPFVPDLPCVDPCDLNRVNVDGTFKVPSLRNVELTGPYFHNGGVPTLTEVVNFYQRGGNFHDINILNLDAAIVPIGSLSNPDNKAELVAFLQSLTDDRVRNESAPFDHPQLLIPNGHPGGPNVLTCVDAGRACDTLSEIPAVGAGGRPIEGLPPLQAFAPRTFEDVTSAQFAFDQIEAISLAGITGGCSTDPSLFCPDTDITRAQMAVFIENSLGLAPGPSCAGTVFIDVNATTVGDLMCRFIEDFAARGITGGCGNGNFCPNDPISRAQMAVFIEAALGNPANPCTGQFADVTGANPFCGFIERLAADGITGGCGNGNFCPDDPVTRAQMAVFLVAAPEPLLP